MLTPRLTALLVAAVAGAATLVGVAGPASAAASIEITPTVKNAVVGEPFDVSWTSSPEVETVVASGDWADPAPTELSGRQTITPRAAGDLTFTLTGQVAGGGQPVVQTRTVSVAAAPTEVTAVAPTYPDTCVIELPEVEGLEYVVDYGTGETEVFDAGRYPVVLLSASEDEPATVTPKAKDGFVLSPDSPTEFTVRVADTCTVQEAELVRTTTACRSVSFTNIADDERLFVEYGDAAAEDSDGSFTLSAGATRTITTNRAVLSYVAGDPALLSEDTPPDDVDLEGQNVDTGSVRVQLNCGHPTVAPAAGR